jgi:hypothetical protein
MSLSRISKKVLVSAGVCVGKTRIHFIDAQKNESELHQLHCMHMKRLDDGLLPDSRNLYPWGSLHVHFSAGLSHILYKSDTRAS